MPDPGPLMRRAAAWTAVLTVIWAGIAAAVWGPEMGLGVAVGAAIGLANLWVLALASASMISRAKELRPAPGRKWALPGLLLIKWPVLIAALALAVLYLPVRAEGIAGGVLVALAAISIAALRRS